MSLDLNSDAMKNAVALAVVQQLTPDRQVALLKEAVLTLLQPTDSGYGYDRTKKSPLQSAFESAVRSLAETVVREKLENDDTFKATIDSILTDAVKRATVEKREETVNKIAANFASFLASYR